MVETEEDSEISKVLFELASNRRASILFEVAKQNLKMQQIAKSLNMTVTETFRHLQRLSDAKLVEKKTDGAYAITSLGKLGTGFLLGFNFILKNADFFLEHDVSLLPYEFVNRLGELSNADCCKEAMSNMNRARKIVLEAEKSLWAMGEQVDSSHIQPTNDKMSKGLEFKFIMQKNLAKEFKNSQAEILKGSRYLERIDVSLLVSEKEASVLFRRHSGVMDYVGLFGTDEKFRKWCTDLFMYYWERAERWYSGIQIE
jgi:predicted transcriptional regulator